MLRHFASLRSVVVSTLSSQDPCWQSLKHLTGVSVATTACVFGVPDLIVAAPEMVTAAGVTLSTIPYWNRYLPSSLPKSEWIENAGLGMAQSAFFASVCPLGPLVSLPLTSLNLWSVRRGVALMPQPLPIFHRIHTRIFPYLLTVGFGMLGLMCLAKIYGKDPKYLKYILMLIINNSLFCYLSQMKKGASPRTIVYMMMLMNLSLFF